MTTPPPVFVTVIIIIIIILPLRRVVADLRDEHVGDGLVGGHGHNELVIRPVFALPSCF